MVTLKRKKTEQVVGYFFSGQTHELSVGLAKASVGDFIVVDDDGEPVNILLAEYVKEAFVVVPKRGRPAGSGADYGIDERQEIIPGTRADAGHS